MRQPRQDCLRSRSNAQKDFLVQRREGGGAKDWRPPGPRERIWAKPA